MERPMNGGAVFFFNVMPLQDISKILLWLKREVFVTVLYLPRAQAEDSHKYPPSSDIRRLDMAAYTALVYTVSCA